MDIQVDLDAAQAQARRSTVLEVNMTAATEAKLIQ